MYNSGGSDNVDRTLCNTAVAAKVATKIEEEVLLTASLRRVIGQFRSLQLPTSLRNTIWDESGSELRRGSSVYNFGVCTDG